MPSMTKTERVDPPFEGDERTMLLAWLEYHRATLAVKCDGLTDEQMRLRSVQPSNLSLLGLVRHMADVESNWFRCWLDGDGPAARYDDDAEFTEVDQGDVAESLEHWKAECENSRRVVAKFDSLDAVGAGQKVGAGMSVRFTLVHMIEEYARHNGHADLIREAIDGERDD
jgi:uncharacterized damage-inducible protein DinB